MSWHCKNIGAYSRTSSYARENAQATYDVLNAIGWCLESVCALLGNVEHESGYNPWRWQSDQVLASTDTYNITHQTGHAYGYCQQDPAGKYIYSNYSQLQYGYGPKFSDTTGNINEGYAQLRYIHHVCEQGLPEWDKDNALAQGLGLPFNDFIANTPNYTVAQLTRTFFGCYERGTWSNNRVTAAEYWYNQLGGYTPVDPPGSDSYASWFAVFKLISKRKNVVLRGCGRPRGGGFQ